MLKQQDKHRALQTHSVKQFKVMAVLGIGAWLLIVCLCLMDDTDYTGSSSESVYMIDVNDL